MKKKCWNCEHICMRRANGNYICAMQDDDIPESQMHDVTTCEDWLLIGTNTHG